MEEGCFLLAGEKGDKPEPRHQDSSGLPHKANSSLHCPSPGDGWAGHCSARFTLTHPLTSLSSCPSWPSDAPKVKDHTNEFHSLGHPCFSCWRLGCGAALWWESTARRAEGIELDEHRKCIGKNLNTFLTAKAIYYIKHPRSHCDNLECSGCSANPLNIFCNYYFLSTERFNSHYGQGKFKTCFQPALV